MIRDRQEVLKDHEMACCHGLRWFKNFQMYKLDLEKAEEPEITLPTSAGS